jgi:hypothetical protein
MVYNSFIFLFIASTHPEYCATCIFFQLLLEVIYDWQSNEQKGRDLKMKTFDLKDI